MFASSTRQAARQYSRSARSSTTARRLFTSSSSGAARHGISTGAVAAMVTVAAIAATCDQDQYASLAARLPSSGDIVSVGVLTKEKATGIMFPSLCNGYSLVGTGVRIKYMFVKVYAVGTYMDSIAMMAVKNASKEEMQKALLDPTYPRTIRIVMNRGLAIDKYTAAIVESLEPRMKGHDLEKLEEFKKLNPPVDLIEGAEIEMTIRGDTLLYKNAVGGVGSIRSRVFTEAMCDVYYGDDPVSPPHKESVLEGIPKL